MNAARRAISQKAKQPKQVPESSHSPLMEVRGLDKSFGSNVVLSNLNLDVLRNESLVVMGRSGTGKSVLIKCMVGLMHPDSGSVKINGQETVGLTESERAIWMNKFGYLFQGGALFDSLPIWKNVAFFFLYNRKSSAAEARHIAAVTLEKVGLGSNVLDLYPQELSGGMQKRVAFARAIAHEPEILLFDEPTSGLDPIMTNIIGDLIINARETLKSTMITITHDINSTRRIATRVAMLHGGQIVWDGGVDRMDRSGHEIVDQFVHGVVA